MSWSQWPTYEKNMAEVTRDFQGQAIEDTTGFSLLSLRITHFGGSQLPWHEDTQAPLMRGPHREELKPPVKRPSNIHRREWDGVTALQCVSLTLVNKQIPFSVHFQIGILRDLGVGGGWWAAAILYHIHLFACLLAHLTGVKQELGQVCSDLSWRVWTIVGLPHHQFQPGLVGSSLGLWDFSPLVTVYLGTALWILSSPIRHGKSLVTSYHKSLTYFPPVVGWSWHGALLRSRPINPSQGCGWL